MIMQAKLINGDEIVFNVVNGDINNGQIINPLKIEKQEMSDGFGNTQSFFTLKTWVLYQYDEIKDFYIDLKLEQCVLLLKASKTLEEQYLSTVEYYLNKTEDQYASDDSSDFDFLNFPSSSMH